MVCKKDVVTWFKGLKSYRRTDVMCTLFNLCLPFELRFLGTCLEHLGKRDFHELRQSENEANNLAELNLPELQCLSNQQVRTKLAVYVSLLYSCNYTCANSIYKILTKNEDVLSILKASGEDTALDDLLLIYTLAINHPGFSIDQKVNLEKIYLQLQEEERRIYVNSASRSNKTNYVGSNSQENLMDKPPPPIQAYQNCYTYDEHFIGVAASPQLPPHPIQYPGDGSGLTGYPFAVPIFVPPQPDSSSPMSRNSSPNSGSPPPPPAGQGQGTASSRGKPPAASGGHPGATAGGRPSPQPQTTTQQQGGGSPSSEGLRDSISKELPNFANSLHPFSHEQLSRMCDEELREMGLNQSAVGQLRAILGRQTNGLSSSSSIQVELKKKPGETGSSDMDQTPVMRGGGLAGRYPCDPSLLPPNSGLALYPGPGGLYSCYAIPAGAAPAGGAAAHAAAAAAAAGGAPHHRKYHHHHHHPAAGAQLHHHPSFYPPTVGGVTGGGGPPAGTVPHHLPPQHHIHPLDFRQLRIASDPSSSDESSPDTPPPHSVEGGGGGGEERLGGGSGGAGTGGGPAGGSGGGGPTGGGGGEEQRRGGGRGRSRHHPPGRPSVVRARGPHIESRHREMNGSGGTEASGGFYSPAGYIHHQYVRGPAGAYPGGGGGGSGYPGGGGGGPGGGGFIRAYPPTATFQQPNGEIVYAYQAPPPPGSYIQTTAAFLQQPPPQPPPPPAAAPAAPPQQLPPPAQQQPQPPLKPLQPPPPLSCYNCGSQAHSAVDCPEPSIEEVTKQGQYRLDFSGGYQKPLSGVEPHLPPDK